MAMVSGPCLGSEGGCECSGSCRLTVDGFILDKFQVLTSYPIPRRGHEGKIDPIGPTIVPFEPSGGAWGIGSN